MACLLRIFSCKRAAHGPLNYTKFREVNSLQLHTPIRKGAEDTYQSVSHRDEKLAKRLRQFLDPTVGILVGIISVTMAWAYEAIWNWRTDVLKTLLGKVHGDSSFAVSCVVLSMILSCAFALLACFPVLWEPASASSGIPGVIAFLNGVDVRQILTPRVLFTKYVGTISIVGSGLVAGPEGPMIHLGSVVGNLSVTHLIRPVLRNAGERLRRIELELERNPLKYDIQCAAMGAGAGVAAAFGAPLAGTLFVVEEASSFFSKRLFMHTFVCCAAAVGTAYVLEAFIGIPFYEFYAESNACWSSPYNSLLWTLLQVVFVAIVCGALAKVFNSLVVQLNAMHVRQAQRLGPCWKLWRCRIFEIAVIAALTGGFAVLFPLCMPCQETSIQRLFSGTNGCIVNDWVHQVMKGSTSMPLNAEGAPRVRLASRLLYGDDDFDTQVWNPTAGLFGAQFDPQNCPRYIAENPSCQLHGIEEYINASMVHDKVQADHYCCGFANRTALKEGRFYDRTSPTIPAKLPEEQWQRGYCQRAYDEVSNVFVDKYSPAATLTLASPRAMVKSLFTQGSPLMLPIGELALFTPMYILFGAFTSAAAVPGGLLVPQMAMGASAGRLIGVLWRQAFDSLGIETQAGVPWSPESIPLLTYLAVNNSDIPEIGSNRISQMLDPGVMAVTGAAAFLSGSGALVLFVIVLLIEITLDPFLIPLIIVSVIIARATASLLGSKHGLYHELIDVQSLPFLDEIGHWRQQHWTVGDILDEDVRRARTLWTGVDDAVPDARSLVISIRIDADARAVRGTLQKVMPGDEYPLAHGFPVVSLEGHLEGLATRASLEGLMSQTASEVPVEHSLAHGATLSSATESLVPGAPIGVDTVMDVAPYVVQTNTPVLQAHMTFRQNGIRHMIVVDGMHRPVGVLTRKSLMPWRTPPPGPSVGRSEVHDTFVETRRAEMLAMRSQAQSRARSILSSFT
mmetsp:Transcript_46393/g.123248  ORF Transcript_46393/g.123248 Transcript_46393/m.123248 type:complete len:962 (-) Transcript_46393:183-3068(-)